MAENYSANKIYQAFVSKTGVPFSDFLEVENRKFKGCKTDDDFITWLNRRYQNSKEKAWFNNMTAKHLKDMGYTQRKEANEMSANGEYNYPGGAEGTLGGTSSDSTGAYVEAGQATVNLISQLIAKGGNKTSLEKELKAECGSSFLAGKKYNACKTNFYNKKAEQANIANRVNQPPASAGMSTGAKVGIVLGALAVTGLIVYLAVQASKKGK